MTHPSNPYPDERRYPVGIQTFSEIITKGTPE